MDTKYPGIGKVRTNYFHTHNGGKYEHSTLERTFKIHQRLQLSIKAELENVTDLVPASDNFEYFFKVKCTSCNEEHQKWVSMNRTEEYEVSGSKNAKAHFVWRCGLCKRESWAKFELSSPVEAYSPEAREFKPLLIVECRGLEFIGFDPQGIWKCVGSSGRAFPEVEFTDGEWTDYDEKAALPVNISDFESRWDRA